MWKLVLEIMNKSFARGFPTAKIKILQNTLLHVGKETTIDDEAKLE